MNVVANDFIANHQVQPWIKEGHYSGSLFQIECEGDTTHAELLFNLNRFDDNNVRGGDAALIYVQGPIIKAHDNIFYRSGQLDTYYHSNLDTASTLSYKINIFDETDWLSY